MKSNYLLLSIMFILLISGCVSSVANTDFKETTGTVKHGKAIGPFSGVIKNSDTKEAISFAQVRFYFIFQKAGKFKTVIKTTKTDIDGKYNLAQFRDFDLWKPGYILLKVKCVVIHKGYLPYISNSSNFTQYNNTINLLPRRANLKSYRFLMPYMGLVDLYRYFTSDFYTAADELSESSDLKLNSSGLILPNQAMKILKIENLPLLKETVILYNESGYALYFDNGTKISWYVKSALVSQIKEFFSKLKSRFDIKSEPPRKLTGIRIYTTKANDTLIGIIPDLHNGILFMLGCKGVECNKDTLIKISELAYERKNTLIFTGGK